MTVAQQIAGFRRDGNTTYGLRLVSAALSVLVALSRPTRAQDGTVGGTVVAAFSQRPLGGAQVSVVGQPGRGAVTDGSGAFRIAGIAGATVALNVRLIGYLPITDTVRIGAAQLHLALVERAFDLNAVVVTGTAGSAAMRELGTSVATVDVSAVLAQTSVPNMDGLLNGRAPGVNIISTTGQIGTGAHIRVRGVGTISLSSTPLIYIDGIRTDNAQTGVGSQLGLVSRFDDIAPDEIERIEVLKGPAAATLYGTEAARGVINVITKRGDAGAPRFSFSAQGGRQWFQNAAGRFPTSYWINPTTHQLITMNAVETEASHGTPLFRTGDIGNYAASASGGTGVYRYFVSGEVSNATGIVQMNGRSQKNVRANQSIIPGGKFTLETNVGYVTSHTTLAAEGPGSGPMWGEFLQPKLTSVNCPTPPIDPHCGWSRGFFGSPPEVTAATQRWQDVQRFTGSASIKYDPFAWLSHRLLVGTDYTLEDINTYQPYQTDSVIVWFLGTAGYDGSRSDVTQQTTYNTYDYSAAAQFDLRPNLTSKSVVGVQYYTNSQAGLSASGSHFPTLGLSTVAATATKTSSSSFVANKTLGAFFQQQLALNDRLFVTGALRVDNNSAFGSQVHFTTYPKASLSWVASDEPAARRLLPWFVTDLRLRAAYGGSGQQPPTNSALQTLTPISGPGGAKALANGTIGNPDLRPERVLGAEMGFEAGLWHERLGIDLTLFSDVSRDAILSSAVAPSTGYGGGTQYRNVGQIDKHGLELALKGEIINRRDYGWSSQFNIAATTAKIVRMGTAADTLIDATPNASSPVGTVSDVFHRVGYAPFDLFTYHVVSATFDSTTGRAINPVCDDGRGGTLPCFLPGTSTLQAPKLYSGHSIPTTVGSWINSIRYRAFRLHVMVDFQAGHRKTDTVFEQNCQLFFVCRIVVFPSQYDPAVVATAQNGGQLQDYFIRSAAFTKLREVSLSYDAPQRLARGLGARTLGLTISGRNLAMRTKYTGIDPENSISAAKGVSYTFGTDQTEYPQLESVVFTLRISY